ncbi:MAG TPA: hypothetical protein VNH18_00085 [Bryobacteraceae bacterium]|nr:hypothetical protein [Bryobacteraceae bacterium]HXJ37636.1 hypothetical protein [Bryobacteraceae bacterium]
MGYESRRGFGADGRQRQVGWRLLLGVPVLLLLLFASEREARAYTDPGSGALIWQMLVAGLVGAAFYVRKFTSWLRRKRGSTDIDQPAEEKQQQP